MSNEPSDLYDDLAGDYELLYADWERSVRYQGTLFSPWLAAHPQRVLDVACGTGLQALGLALAGHAVVGRDISSGAIARLLEHTRRFGVDVRAEIGDMRVARPEDAGQFDAVVAFDNALPHLESDEELLSTLRAARAALRPAGRLLVSIRDYDAIVKERPQFDPPRLLGEGASERIVLQLWRWKDERRYDFEIILLQRDEGRAWRSRVLRGSYRALLRSELTELARAAGFRTLEWLTAEQAHFYQPVLVARD